MHKRVADAFRATFRTIEVAHTNRFKGRDEADFIAELFRENRIFVTSDRVFVDAAIENGLRHVGICFIHEHMTVDEKVLFAEIAGGFIRGVCSVRTPCFFRGRVLYVGHDGLRSIVSKKNSLEISWDDPMVFPE